MFSLEHQAASCCGGTITAPRSHVCYESGCGNVEALVASYMRAEKISQSEAAAMVESDIYTLESTIASGRTLTIQGVGALSYSSKAPVFESAMLPTMASLTIEPLEREDADPSAVDAAAEALRRRREALVHSLRRTAQSAAAIIIFVIVAFVVMQLPQHADMPSTEAGIGLSAPAKTETLIPQPGTAEHASLVLILNTPTDASDAAETLSEKTERRLAQQRYALVVASLANEREAEAYMSTHNNDSMPLSILVKDGRWRIVALNGATPAELTADAHQAGIYDIYPSAWVCRR